MTSQARPRRQPLAAAVRHPARQTLPPTMFSTKSGSHALRNPVPAGTERLESHERGMKILPVLQHPERGADAAGQHADGRQPSDGPEPVAAIHRAKPQPRAQRTQPCWTPFSIQQQGSREKQGTKGRCLRPGTTSPQSQPWWRKTMPGTVPRVVREPAERRPRTAQQSRPGPAEEPDGLRPFAPFKTVGCQWPFSRPHVGRIS